MGIMENKLDIDVSIEQQNESFEINTADDVFAYLGYPVTSLKGAAKIGSLEGGLAKKTLDRLNIPINYP